MNTENGKAEFKKSFRGYSREEVDEYVENAARDIDSLRGEISDLCRKLSAANEEIENTKALAMEKDPELKNWKDLVVHSSVFKGGTSGVISTVSVADSSALNLW